MSVPEFTTLAVSIEPVVDPAPTLTVPAETVSAPVNELAPESVSVPVPCLVSFPPDPDTMPAKVVDALPAEVSVLVTEPEPSEMLAAESLELDVAIDATVSL